MYMLTVYSSLYCLFIYTSYSQPVQDIPKAQSHSVWPNKSHL